MFNFNPAQSNAFLKNMLVLHLNEMKGSKWDVMIYLQLTFTFVYILLKIYSSFMEWTFRLISFVFFFFFILFHT